MQEIQVLIIDYGSQYTLVIGRTLRELGVRSIILSPGRAGKWLRHSTPRAVILSGSNWSVHWRSAPDLPPLLDRSGKKYFVLGVCYGMQLLAHRLGGKVSAPHKDREYGPALALLNTSHPLFRGVKKKTVVWASHGDTVVKLPKGFNAIARSSGIAGMSSKNGKVLGVQFHPEVVETREGKKILKNFLKLSGCEKDWDPLDLVHEIQQEVRKIVNKNKVILGFSGGVDSTTLARVLSPVLGNRLICVAIDTGGVRAGEMEEIKRNARSAKVKKLVIVRAEKEFIRNVSKTISGEEKRKKFREIYQRILEKEIKKHKAKFILQGTLATDIIESGHAGQSTLIKTHHNVGLSWKVRDLHPLRNLFKYEVRELARALRMPKTVFERQPFPGPGLYLRIVGTPVSKEKLGLVREADESVREILSRRGLMGQISQLIVALLGVDSVGVKGDERVYGHSLAVRAVSTSDFMTVKGFHFPREVVDEITSALTKHREIVRVFFDMTPKPPATTEFE